MFEFCIFCEVINEVYFVNNFVIFEYVLYIVVVFVGSMSGS